MKTEKENWKWKLKMKTENEKSGMKVPVFQNTT